MALRDVPVTTISIGGTEYPLAQPISAIEALAPEVDRSAIQIPLGRFRHDGEWVTSEPSFSPGDAMVITCGDFTWTGEVSSFRESGSARRRVLAVEGIGLGGILERGYPHQHLVDEGGSAHWRDGFPDFNFGNRGNRRAGEARFGGTARWSQLDAVTALLAQAADATHGCGIPALTLAGTTSGLTGSDTWSVYGSSVHAALMGILSARGRHAWRAAMIAGTPTLTVHPLDGTGAALDLCRPFVTDYSYGLDGSGTVATLIAHGQRRTYVQTLLAYPGGSGDFDGDWGSADVARLDARIAAFIAAGKSPEVAAEAAAAEEGGPAFRRFTLTPGALPDGSDRSKGQLQGGLPMSGGDTTWTDGGGPWLVFLKEWNAATSSYLWRAAPVSVQVLGANRIWIDGPGWVQRFRAADRAAITCGIQSRVVLAAAQGGGAGSGVALMNAGAGLIAASSNAALAASSAGTLIEASHTSQDDTDSLAENLADRWAQLRGFHHSLSWTEVGIAGGSWPVGALIGSIQLPAYPTPRTVTTERLLVARRSVSWRGRKPTTTWNAEPPLLAESAQVR